MKRKLETGWLTKNIRGLKKGKLRITLCIHPVLIIHKPRITFFFRDVTYGNIKHIYYKDVKAYINLENL